MKQLTYFMASLITAEWPDNAGGGAHLARHSLHRCPSTQNEAGAGLFLLLPANYG